MKNSRLLQSGWLFAIMEYAVESAGPILPGEHSLGIRFVPSGSHTRPDYFTGDVVLTIDGVQVGELKDIKMAAQYSSMTGYGLLIGRNTGTPVSHEYAPPFVFTGDLANVTIKLKQ